MAVMDAGTEFGGYRIERLLGAGGFCNVYLAEDLRPALKRKVALKVLNPTLSADDKNRERFQRESLLAVELDDHPNIVGVLDAGEQDGQLFIAQRYIEGHDLGQQIVDGGPLDAERAVDIVAEIGGALDYAHQAGLVHRDVKPRNILVRDRDGRCFLADFGLTKRTASSDSLTGAGEFLGTFAYAAPEQLGGKAVDGRADLYALGCVLFESLTGTPPFSGDIHSMITSHLTKSPPRASEAVSGLPPAIDAVIEKAMAKEPEDRYQTGQELAEAAHRALRSSGLPPPVVLPPPPPASTTVQTPAATPAPAADSVPPPPGAPTPAASPTPSPGFTSGGAGFTPPPGGPTPTPAGGSGGGSKTPLLIGGVVVLLVLVVGAVLLSSGGGDDGGGGDPTTTTVDEDAEALEEAQQAAEDAFDELPDDLQDACELDDVEDNDRGVIATMSCEPDEGADEIAITVFEDEDDVGDAFADAEDNSAEDLEDPGDCSVDRYAAQAWTSNDEPDAVLGQVACYLTDDEEAELVWTVDDQSLVAVAHRNDDSDGSLYEWWADLVDVAPLDTGDDFPNAEEETLLSHVPSDYRDTCERAELRPQETASVQCHPESGAASVFYNQYPDGQGAQAEYEALRRGNDVERNTGQNNECPFEGRLTVGEETQGRVFCAMQDGGGSFMAWSNRPLAIQAEATIAENTTVAEFWTWWTTAGPS
jgi:serine/threonine protein kinase